MTGRTLEEIEALAAEATLLPLSLDEIVDRLAAVDRSKVDGVSWRTIDLVIAIAQGQREEIARLKRLVKMALLEGVAICTHREDLTEPWENGDRAWNGSKASEEVNMAIGTKK